MHRLHQTLASIAIAAFTGGLASACGARTELGEESVPQAEGCVVHRPAGLDGCLRFGRLGAPAETSDSKLVAFLEANGAVVERISDVPRINLDTLDRFDIVIVEAPTRLHDEGEARLVFDYVSSGHGLLVTSGYRIDEGDKPETNSMIAELGVAFVGDLLNGDVTAFATHATSAGVARLPFLGGYGMTTVATVGDHGGGLVPVAMFGPATVGAALPLGKGRAFFWGDDWIEFDEEWTGQNDTPTFWLDVMRWLAHQS